MKFLLFYLLMLSAEIITAQTGKPQYNIRCEREGTFIGDIKVELFPLIAPKHTANFDSLVSINFYDSTAFHRVAPNFVIQGGDPNSRHGDPSTWGNGDPGQTNVPAEFSDINHSRGTLGAARDNDINSATSQFFINVVDNPGLNRRYTVYGKVFEGMNVADSIVNSPTVPGTERPVQKIEMFITKLASVNNNIPGPPVLTSPLDNQEGVTGLQTFQWAAVDDAVLYRLQIAADENFNSIIIDSTIGRTEISFSNLQQGLITYYWRAAANNGGNVSGFSEIRKFTTGISAPVLVSPEDSLNNVSFSPVFHWNSVPGASAYRFQLATTPGFFGVGLIVNQAAITDTTFSVTGLLPDKKYYWRVKGTTTTYEGSYSQTRSFTTTGTTAVLDDNTIISFRLAQNFPNPFNPSTKIKFSIPGNKSTREKAVTLKVFNVVGNQVATLVNAYMGAGEYEIDFNGSKLASGMYFYTLRAGSAVLTRKMILLK